MQLPKPLASSVKAALITIAGLAAFSAAVHAHDWRSHYSTEVSYRVINMSAGGSLNVRSRPGAGGVVVARLRKGTSGIQLKTCVRHAAWCRIEVGGDAGTITGWVSMKYLGGYAN